MRVKNERVESRWGVGKIVLDGEEYGEKQVDVGGKERVVRDEL